MIEITHIDRYEMPNGEQGYSFHVIIGKVLLYGACDLACIDLVLCDESLEVFEFAPFIQNKIKDAVYKVVETEKVNYNAKLLI